MRRNYADHWPYYLVWTDRFGSGEAVHLLGTQRLRPRPDGGYGYAGHAPDDPAAARRAVARILREFSTPAAALRWVRHEWDYEVPPETWRPRERDRLVRRLGERCEALAKHGRGPTDGPTHGRPAESPCGPSGVSGAGDTAGVPVVGPGQLRPRGGHPGAGRFQGLQSVLVTGRPRLR